MLMASEGEVGCDEAGRGALAGPVVAAAVILPCGFTHPLLDDSKKLTRAQRNNLRSVIEQHAIALAIGLADVEEINRLNILRATMLAMHRALDALNMPVKKIVVDGNRFTPYRNVPHRCIVKGDGLYASIAAASIIAKCYRDALMQQLHEHEPRYDWLRNKGYGTEAHRKAIQQYGPTTQHRRLFVRHLGYGQNWQQVAIRFAGQGLPFGNVE